MINIMTRISFKILFVLCILVMPIKAQDVLHYYFRTLDIRNGLSQNTVNTILQDRKGFMWFGTKDGLNRFDGLSFRVFKREDTKLGNNIITALFEDKDGNIWVGTDAGVYIFNQVSEQFTAFDKISNTGCSIKRAVTLIAPDEKGNIWISSDYDGLFCYDTKSAKLFSYLHRTGTANVTRFWFENNISWVALYADNLYYTNKTFNSTLHPFVDSDGREVFKGDIINTQVKGPHNCIYVGSSGGLTEVNLTTRKTRRILNAYVRTLQFKSDGELWAGTESGLYVYDLIKDRITHLSAPYQDNAYSLSDNAIYSLCRDKEDGMWIGSYFGGINYYPKQWTYFEKFYPRDDIENLGRRVREFCESNDGTVWIGTEDKGLFHFDPFSGKIEPFEHPSIYKNIHGLCLDGDNLWVGTFSGGLNRINLKTKQVKHYEKGEAANTINANDAFSICKTTTGDLFIGTTSGLLRYNRSTDDFTRIPRLNSIFVYKILEDFNGNIWLATYSNGVFRYDVKTKQWKNFTLQKDDPESLPYNKVISIFEDSHKRLWFMTQGAGFCRFDPKNQKFIRYDMSKGFPSNIIYKMVEDNRGKLWLTTSNGLVSFTPETGEKHIYTTANGLLSNQFNYQSGYRDKKGHLYFGSINGFIVFNPENFAENTFVPPVVITDFYLFNKRLPIGSKQSPLQKSITYSDEIELASDQNSFSFHVAALSYQAPEMNKLVYKLEGFDKEWYSVDKSALISYSNLPYGTYKFHLKGSNSDGKWNTSERILKIHIRPPFYLSPFAYAVYVLIIIFSIVSLISYFRRKAIRRHKQAMETFEHEKERELYTAKIDFFTNVAHEIRTPLTLIKSPLENVLSSGYVNKDIKDDLEIMDLNTNRLLDLVNQLLDFRKTETEGFQLNFVECNVSEILRKTYVRFTPLMKQRGLDITLNCPDDIKASVDKEGFTKIISNLLTNAVKYAETYVKVDFTQDDHSLKFSICNDGQIIPLDMREEVFKPFVQYKRGAERSVSGTGIGLALARSLAELHEGTLSMDSSMEYNGFILTLPTTHEHTIDILENDNKFVRLESNNNFEKATMEGHYESIGQSRYTLLIVEDNPEMRSFVAKQLALDYTLFTASNGIEALQVLKEQTINLVISDIVMPEMDGLQLCDYLKSELDYSHIPIILLTAKTTLQSKIEGLRSGADAYIEKPFSVEYLKVCVSNLLNNREKLRMSFVHSPFVQTNTIAMTKADESFLRNLKEIIVENMQNPDFSLDDMADLLNMSRSSLNRKIKGILDMTPNDYIRLERLKKSAQLLKEGECKINEICYMVGFNTPSYFTKCFLKQFGVLPKDFRG